MTKAILAKHLREDSNCVDVGAHKGEMVDELRKYSKHGKIWAFEPLPHLFSQLKQKYAQDANVKVLSAALSNKQGTSSFNFVKNAAAYSGIKQRKYDIKNSQIEEIEVELNTLDAIIPQDVAIDFIKIDVEGAEFDVLKGARETILRANPLIVFECGLGASNFYGTEPESIFRFIKEELKKDFYTLKAFLGKDKSLTLEMFKEIYLQNTDYYFIAK